MMNFFAILVSPGRAVRRLPLSAEVQERMTSLFRQQRDQILDSDREFLPFQAGFSPDVNELMYIDDFALPSELVAFLANPANTEILASNLEELGSIASIVGRDQESHEVLFQVFDRRRLLSPAGKFNVIYSQGTLIRLEDPGLTLDTQLVACFSGSRLYFRSYHMAKRVLDLTEYYREATNQDLSRFCELNCLVFEDTGLFVSQADSWVRQKVALILDSKILQDVGAHEISARAKQIDLKVNFETSGGVDHLVLPKDKKDLKWILRFLNEDIYPSLLTSNVYVANSKRQFRKSS